MAMTKKEKEALEAALTISALRTTSDVDTDVAPPTGYELGLSKGWGLVAVTSDMARVVPACSSSAGHGYGRQDKTTSQHSIHLYSTKLLALKALRRAVEKDCARRLRAIDVMIQEEIEVEQP